jgi:hypothetical protein
MRVTLEVPEDIARALASGPLPLDRAALEALAAEGYRRGLLSESQVMRLLSLTSRFAVHDWLRERQIPFRYTEADLSDDMAALTDLGLR